MTWFLPDVTRPDLAPATRPPATAAELRAAGREAQTIEDDSWNRSGRVADRLARELREFLPEDLRAPLAALDDPYPDNTLADPDSALAARAARQRPALIEALSKATARDPARYGSFGGANTPLTAEDFDKIVLDRRQAEYDEAAAVLAAAPEGSWFSEFLGRGYSAMTDPTSLATMGIGAPARVGMIAKIGIEAAAGAGSELLIAPQKARVASELDVPEPNLLGDMATGALFAGGLTGAVLGIGKGIAGTRRMLEYRQAKRTGAQADRPDGIGAGEHEGNIEAAAQAIAEDRQVPEPAGGTLPAIEPDAPANWQAIRGGIFAGESGGDYEALFGYSNRDGGQFANVRLTEMTVDEAITFSHPRGAYAQWVKGKVGRVATPMGAYQIVGTTLRAAKKGLGLTGKEVMTEELQERLGQWIYRQQGTGAWEGYRGPRGDFTPGTNDGPAPRTSRGYTRPGEISVGDSTRVGIRYEVVDASALTRASGRFQPRDRSQVNSDAWVAETAAGLDPAQLMPSPNAATGTPLVGPDGMIESGNGRFMAIERAYARHPDRAEAYRAEIEAADFDIPEGVTRPVLIARRTTDLDDDARAALTVAAQDSGVAQMTPSEIAGAVARDLTPERLATLDPAQRMTADANRPFVQSVLATLPKSVRNGMFAGRELTADAERMLARAVFARAFDDPALIRAYVSTETGGEFRTLLGALERAAPSWAAMRGEVAAGRLRPEFDITGHLTEALTLIAGARTSARGGAGVNALIEELLADIDLLDGALSPLTIGLVRKLWPNGKALPEARMTEFLTRYAEEARKIGGTEGGLFAAPSPADTLRAIDAKTFAELPDDFGTPRAGGIETEPAEALPDEAFDKGADSPEVEAAMEAPAAPPEPARAKPRTALGRTVQDLKDRAADAVTDMRSRAALDDLRAEFGDVAVRTGDDGQSLRIEDLIDDLDQDARLEGVIDACMTGAAT